MHSNAQRPGIAPPEEDPNAEILCASPPCFMHELDASWLGLQNWDQVRAWRRTKRTALVTGRLAVPAEERQRRDAVITAHLREEVPDLAHRHVGFYWPFKGEYDPRPLAYALEREGARLALPVVVARGQPLVFRSWRRGVRMVPGVWNIPIPADGEEVVPDTLLIPLVGFDGQHYRLGYGGGYYDRTLSTMEPRPLAIGIGFRISRLASIHPQPHDVPMDLIITEGGRIRPGRAEPA